ncbi:MAG: CocE/NonD family hydrolase [Deltaproteobacteria bacterium]|nr:CocE/NonD family hydrolase [Deltaproteobacteria bacterium]
MGLNADASTGDASSVSAGGGASDSAAEGAVDSGGADAPDAVADLGDSSADTSTDDSPALDCLEIVTYTANEPKTPYPGGRWTVPEPTFGTVIENNVQIEMSDGVVLVGDVSYPTDLGTGERAAGEFPVILTQNPYGPVFSAASGEIFVTHGYIFASIDVRGTSRSEGVHDMFSPREAEDGAALVSWEANLEGSDGRVGLQGCSQLGINQLETATLLGANSPVKAMIPAFESGDFYRDTAFDNGIPTLVGLALAAPDATEGGDRAYYREYWRERDRVARAPAIARADIPTLLWAGWHEPGTLGSFELYTVLQNVAAGRPASAPIKSGREVSGKYQVILGDWGHAGGLDMGIQLQWYDTWIKGIDTGLPTDTKTPLHLAELGGTKRWINARCYPLVEKYTPFFLSSAGKLSASADKAEGQDELTWVAPGQPSDFIEYASEPFADGAMLAGPPAARLHVTSSNTNLQLVIEVFDRAPDGNLAKISRGSILGALRRTDSDKSWLDKNGLPARPFLALDEDQPLTPGEPTQLDIPLWPTLWSIEPGHGIVVRISTQPRSEDCLNPLGIPVGCYPTNPMQRTLAGGVYALHRGEALGSLINLPLLDYGALTTASSAVSPTGNDRYPLPVDW